MGLRDLCRHLSTAKVRGVDATRGLSDGGDGGDADDGHDDAAAVGKLHSMLFARCADVVARCFGALRGNKRAYFACSNCFELFGAP